MNNNSLPIYYSKDGLSSRFYDYSNTYYLPTVCFLGMITCTLCILGSFEKDNTKSQTLTFILINSCIDLLFLITQFFVFTFRCGTLCPFGYSYLSTLYEIEVFWFLGYALTNSQVLLGIYVSYDRLRMFSNVVNQNKFSLYLVYAICAVLALSVNSFTFSVAYTVQEVGLYISNTNTTDILYQAGFRQNFQTPLMQAILTTCMLIKDSLMYLIFCFVNILVLIKFRKFSKKKQALIKGKNTSKA